MRTLEARKRVMRTDTNRKTLDHPFCGDEDMKFWSLMQSSRQMEKKGSKHPFSTYATRITTVRSALALMTTVAIKTMTNMMPR